MNHSAVFLYARLLWSASHKPRQQTSDCGKPMHPQMVQRQERPGERWEQQDKYNPRDGEPGDTCKGPNISDPRRKGYLNTKSLTCTEVFTPRGVFSAYALSTFLPWWEWWCQTKFLCGLSESHVWITHFLFITQSHLFLKCYYTTSPILSFFQYISWCWSWESSPSCFPESVYFTPEAWQVSEAERAKTLESASTWQVSAWICGNS